MNNMQCLFLLSTVSRYDVGSIIINAMILPTYWYPYLPFSLARPPPGVMSLVARAGPGRCARPPFLTAHCYGYLSYAMLVSLLWSVAVGRALLWSDLLDAVVDTASSYFCLNLGRLHWLHSLWVFCGSLLLVVCWRVNTKGGTPTLHSKQNS